MPFAPTNCPITNYLGMYPRICLLIHQVALCSYNIEMIISSISLCPCPTSWTNASGHPLSASLPAANCPTTPVQLCLMNSSAAESAIAGTVKHHYKAGENMATHPSSHRHRSGWALLLLCNSASGACPQQHALLVSTDPCTLEQAGPVRVPPGSPIARGLFIQPRLLLCLHKGMVTGFFCTRTVIGKS